MFRAVDIWRGQRLNFLMHIRCPVTRARQSFDPCSLLARELAPDRQARQGTRSSPISRMRRQGTGWARRTNGSAEQAPRARAQAVRHLPTGKRVLLTGAMRWARSSATARRSWARTAKPQRDASGRGHRATRYEVALKLKTGVMRATISTASEMGPRTSSAAL